MKRWSNDFGNCEYVLENVMMKKFTKIFSLAHIITIFIKLLISNSNRGFNEMSDYSLNSFQNLVGCQKFYKFLLTDFLSSFDNLFVIKTSPLSFFSKIVQRVKHGASANESLTQTRNSRALLTNNLGTIHQAQSLYDKPLGGERRRAFVLWVILPMALLNSHSSRFLWFEQQLYTIWWKVPRNVCNGKIV